MTKRILIFVFLLSIAILIYLFSFGKDQILLMGKPAPLFIVESLSDSKFSLKDEVGKKVYLVNIWATYCPPCREEIPVLNEIKAGLDATKFEIIGIMEDEVDDPIKRKSLLDRFQKTLPMNYPVYYDSDGSVADAFGTYQIPESYIIDLKGNLVHKHVGPITPWDKAQLLKVISELMKP